MPDWMPPSNPAIFAHLVFVQTAVSGEEVVAEEPQRGAAAGAGQAERVERPILCALRGRKEEEIKQIHTDYRVLRLDCFMDGTTYRVTL